MKTRTLPIPGFHRKCGLIPVFIVLALASDIAGACRCPDHLSYNNAYNRAEVVLTGKVASFKSGPGPTSWVAVIAVTKTWKMPVPDSVTVATDTTCASHLEEGQEYLLYLFRNQDGGFYTSKCVGNLWIPNARGALAWLEHHGRLSKGGASQH